MSFGDLFFFIPLIIYLLCKRLSQTSFLMSVVSKQTIFFLSSEALYLLLEWQFSVHSVMFIIWMGLWDTWGRVMKTHEWLLCVANRKLFVLKMDLTASGILLSKEVLELIFNVGGEKFCANIWVCHFLKFYSLDALECLLNFSSGVLNSLYCWR